MIHHFIEIDTKETCLLCYDPCLNGDRNDSDIGSLSSSLLGLKQLLRYLKVNTKELFNCSPEFLHWMEIKHDIDVQITLCGKCSLVTEQFHVLYKQYELLQLQFGKCVGSLHQLMKTGNESDERVREFKRKMRPNKSVDIINASIASNLRSKTFKKCELKLKNSIPRVALLQINGSGSAQTPETYNAMNQDHQTADMQTSDEYFDDKLVPISRSNQLSQSRLGKRKASPPNYNKEYIKNKESQDQNPIHLRNVADPNVSQENKLQIVSVTSQRAKDKIAIKNTNLIANDGRINKFSQLSKSSEGETSDSFDQVKGIEKKTKIKFRSTIRTPQTKKKRTNLSLGVNQSKWIREMMASKKNLCCNICQASFAISTSLRIHYYTKHSEYVFSESYNSAFSREQWKTKLNNALQHLYSLSSNSDRMSWFRCCYCKKIFKQKLDYKNHLLCMHTSEIVSLVDPSSSALLESTSSQDLSYKCEYCPFTSNLSGNLRNHTLDMHTVEIVWPVMDPNTCKIECGEATEAVLADLHSKDGQCPKCFSKLTQFTGLRRHFLRKHFKEFVQDVKSLLFEDKQAVRGARDVEFPEEMILPIEFGEENVKLELMPNSDQEQLDPLGFEDFVE